MTERRWLRRRPRDFPTWPRRRPVRWVRRVLFSLGVQSLVRIGYAMDVRGREHLQAVGEPCLIVSNHCQHVDMANLLRAMPTGFRQRVAIAAAASDIFGNPVRGFGSALLGNAFPFATEGGGIRDSLENVNRMLADGWNVLIFPEGRLTVNGPMQPFKGGVGLLARETHVPVVPLRIDILKPGVMEGGPWLPFPRGHIRVSIGPPVSVGPDLRYAEATALLERAVRDA